MGGSKILHMGIIPEYYCWTEDWTSLPRVADYMGAWDSSDDQSTTCNFLQLLVEPKYSLLGYFQRIIALMKTDIMKCLWFHPCVHVWVVRKFMELGNSLFVIPLIGSLWDTAVCWGPFIIEDISSLCLFSIQSFKQFNFHCMIIRYIVLPTYSFSPGKYSRVHHTI